MPKIMAPIWRKAPSTDIWLRPADGVAVSVVQTVTQVQEMTLSFVPKLVATGAILVFGGNWMIRELVAWVTALWTQIGAM